MASVLLVRPYYPPQFILFFHPVYSYSVPGLPALVYICPISPAPLFRTGNSQTRGRIGTGVPLPSASYIPSMPDFLPREQWFGIFLASSTWVELCVQAYTYTWYALLHKVGAFPAVVVFSNHTYILLRSIFYKKSKNVSCE